MAKKPTTIYRSLLRDAWQVTWQRKSLWVFGLLAGILASGSVVDAAFSGIKRITKTSSLFTQLLDQTFIGYSYASQFIIQIYRIGTTRFTVLLITLTIAAVGIICASVLSQAALIHAASSPQKHPRDIRRHVLPHFWDVFALNFLTKLLSFGITFFTTLPVFLFLIGGAQFKWIAFIHLLLYIPIMILLRIFFMMTLIDIVETNSRILQSLSHATTLLKKHWLAAVEFGIILFLLVMIATLGGILFLSLLLGLFGYLYNAVILSGSTTGFLLLNFFSLIVFFFILFTFAGAVVTFQFTAWQMFYTRTTHRIFGRNPFAKIWRWLFA